MKFKNIYTVGDIHGEYAQFELLLNTIKFDESKDLLITLGDYVDRGPEPSKVISKLKELNEKGCCISLLGNHDQMFIENFEILYKLQKGIKMDYSTMYGFDFWKQANGGQATYDDYKNKLELGREHSTWLQTLNYYAPIQIEDYKFICVHAGFLPDLNLHEQPKNIMIWDRDMIYNAKNGYPFEAPFVDDKTFIIVGHTVFDKENISKFGNVINIDTGCGKGGCLSALNLINFDSYSVWK